MIGIIPAAGAGQRIQPLGCSKELLPVGSRVVNGAERPKAVAERFEDRDAILEGRPRLVDVPLPRDDLCEVGETDGRAVPVALR